ncbi:MAG: hypothetical protein LBH03_05125 [Holophagales bacterium]|nr:hypothetical protein [Holophagales bacterium]
MKHKRGMPFCELSKTRRRAEWFRIRWKIEKDRDIYGGRFTSPDVIFTPGGLNCKAGEVMGEWDCPDIGICTPDSQICNQSLDFYFLGLHRHEIWCAEIVTARCEFWEMVDSIAFDRAYAMLSAEQKDMNLFGMGTGPCKRDRNGKVLGNEIIWEPPPLFPEFGGLSFDDYTQQLEREIIANEPPEMFECFEFNLTETQGLGLKIILDVSAITVPLVNQVIDRFFEMGRKQWRSSSPIARDRLPAQSQMDYWRSVHQHQ